MKTQNSSNKSLIGAGIFAAIAASLCCITPVLAFVAGMSGFASAFSWLDPLRPYLMGTSVLVLSVAWYQKLKPRKEIACECEEDDKPSFWQSKKFLAIVTIFAAIMLTFPYYSHIFYPETKANVIIVQAENVQTVNFEIEGMTCTGCEEHVKYAVAQLPGYIDILADHTEGKATVKFDKSKSTLDLVVEAINETGYTVTDYNIVNNKH